MKSMKILGWLLVGLFGVAWLAPASITQIGGLAVAQTGTLWNNLRDFAAGDGQVNGAALMSPCLFNGSSCDRQRGSIANGAQVDVTRSPGSNTTPTDGFANPSNAQTTWSLNAVFDSSSWNRMLGVGGLLSVVPSQSRTGTVTQQTVSAANTAVSITITGSAGRLSQVNGLDAFCSAGTAGITITRTTGPTTVWSTPAAQVGVTLFSKEFPVPLTASVAGDSVTVTLSACGAASTGTLMVRGGLGL